MKEIFKSIKGYEGLYEVSNLGNVRSVLRSGTKGGYIKPWKSNRGYLDIKLSKDGFTKQFLIHRLVAEAFLPNPNNFPEINHKDEIKTNNNVENLEWCDHKYNSNYGTRNKRVSKATSKPVLQYFPNGTLFATYNSMREAEINTKIRKSHISECCNGKLKTAGGFIWRFK